MSLISSPPAPPPQQFTTADGTIQGTIDGTNPTFTVGAYCRRVKVYKNGIIMSLNVDVAFGGTGLVFLNNQQPQPGDVVTMEGWI